ncbi:SMP-30/gluconolactonase/LRE family protein [Aspergillus tanneri]|uniref:Uncharacterized protein n=1 Tax=Aspergillus tanneri TaxID=1220188 RepID=A0A5M9MUY7_9EURO|nr:uncharacterized protein ATNIH1004_003574 [Aspergillus tanneri]KAA8650885.1 hypothetical protein ATNIH1004_003574 [Aspergillus tanneri]
MRSEPLSISVLGVLQLATALLSPLPLEFRNTPAQWAYLSYDNPSFAVIPGHFNRSAFVSQTDSVTSDPEVTKAHNETASLNKIIPDTLEKTTLLNNFYGLPFQGLNDLDIDPEGNFWITDDHYGWGRGVVNFTPPLLSTVYFVNGTTMRPRPFHVTTYQANGVAFSKGGDGKGTIYISNTGAVSPDKSHAEHPYRPRTIEAYDVSYPGALTSSSRLVSVPISFVYDGVRASRNGWIFAGAGNGVDVLDPETGLALGTIRVGGGNYVAVNTALGENELWIVGAGGVWHVTGIRETLARDF